MPDDYIFLTSILAETNSTCDSFENSQRESYVYQTVVVNIDAPLQRYAWVSDVPQLKTMIRILALQGSLRENSASNLIVNAIVSTVPSNVSIEICGLPGSLPHFNDSSDTPEIVAEFREQLRRADAVLICTPEYAFGIPGTLKNAIDWTVGSGEFVEKPVALVTASSQGEKGHAALLLVLEAVSANVPEGASLLISYVRTKLDAQGNVKDPKVSGQLRQVVASLCAAVAAA